MEAFSKKPVITGELPLRWTTRITPSLLQSDVWLRRTSVSNMVKMKSGFGTSFLKKCQKSSLWILGPREEQAYRPTWKNKSRYIGASVSSSIASETLILPNFDLILPKQFTPNRKGSKKHVCTGAVLFSMYGQIIRQCYGLNFVSVTAWIRQCHTQCSPFQSSFLYSKTPINNANDCLINLVFLL